MAKRARRQAGAKQSPDQIIDATLELVLVEGWSRLSMIRIADSVGLSLEELHRIYPTKGAILNAFSARIDATMASTIEAAGESDATARDRTFEVVMARFDALSLHRDAVRTIARDLRRDPVASLCTTRSLRRSIRWMLECAGLSSGGFWGIAKAKGLAIIYLTTFGVWLRDDSEDMAKTMASLDRQLARTEQLIRRGCAIRRRDSFDDAAVAS